MKIKRIKAIALLMLASMLIFSQAVTAFATGSDKTQALKTQSEVTEEMTEELIGEVVVPSEQTKEPVSKENYIYYVDSLDAFKSAIESINEDNNFSYYEIHLNSDISCGTASNNDSPKINKDVTILGHGYTLNLGTKVNFFMLKVGAGGKLSLGRENPTGNENELTITVTPMQGYTQQALVLITEAGTLNMYNGVKLTGNTVNGSSLGSAVCIQNGTFNMYGGEICGNTNRAQAGMGGAVTGRPSSSSTSATVSFNMYGGSIHDNVTDSNSTSYSAAVFIMEGTFRMYGGEISNNKATRKQDTIYNYGGGVSLYQSDGVFEAGKISGNTGSVYGGGIYACDLSNIEIKEGFVITENTASYGGGLNFNSEGTAKIEAGAVIANNVGSNGGDDISFYGDNDNCLNLSDASQMNVNLTETGEKITGWYHDAPDNRWTSETAQIVDHTFALSGETYHLKAAHGKKFLVTYEYVSGTEGQTLPEAISTTSGDYAVSDDSSYYAGETVNIAAAAPGVGTTYAVTENSAVVGTWRLESWSPDSGTTMTEGGVTFTGTWVFTVDKDEEETPPVMPDNPDGETPDDTDSGTTPDSDTSTGDDQTGDKDNPGTGATDSPQTGDDSNIALWLVLMLTAGAGLTGTILCSRKRKYSR